MSEFLDWMWLWLMEFVLSSGDHLQLLERQCKLPKRTCFYGCALLSLIQWMFILRSHLLLLFAGLDFKVFLSVPLFPLSSTFFVFEWCVLNCVLPLLTLSYQQGMLRQKFHWGALTKGLCSVLNSHFLSVTHDIKFACSHVLSSQSFRCSVGH